MDLRPLRDALLVRPDPPPTVIGSIHVPAIVPSENPNYLTMTSTVIAVGADFLETVQVGQKVVHNRFAGKQFKHQGETFLILAEEDVLMAGPGDTPVMLPGYMDAVHTPVRDLPLTWADDYERTKMMR